MDLVVAMDECVAGEHAPLFPGNPRVSYWDFADPFAEGMTETERTRSFEKAFWQIVRQVSAFIELPQYAAPTQLAAPSVEVLPACGV
jgi:protein-tyrosine-phosphatase